MRNKHTDAGHVDLLEAARKLGDHIIVGLHTDDSVNQYRGANYPIMNLHERVLSVLSCRYVDEVVLGAPLVITPEVLDHFKISVVVSCPIESPSGHDSDPFALPRARGLMREILTGNTLSSADIVKRIIDQRLAYEERNRKKLGQKRQEELLVAQP